MQKLSFHAQPVVRVPMLDLTNLHQSTFDHSKLTNASSGAKLAFQPMTARAKSTLDSFPVPKCKHTAKLNSITNQYWNCVDCGAFISYEGISGIQEESRRSHLEITPSILMEKMIEKQQINRSQTGTLEKSEILSRKKVVDWLCETGESIRLTPECIHKAAHFLDVIMAENTVAQVDLQPLGLVCLLLSAKLTEKDSQVGQIKILFERKMNIGHTFVRKYEMQVLSLLHWDLQCTTAMEFIQFFISQGVLFTNDRVNTSKGKRGADEKLATTLRQYAEFFADMCLQEYAFISVSSWKLAASIIAAARKTLGVEQVWSKELITLTGLEFEAFSEIVQDIFKHYNILFPKSKPKVAEYFQNENVAPKTERSQISRNFNGLTYGLKRFVQCSNQHRVHHIQSVI